MERDRVATLTLQAAAAGIVDLSRADLFDSRWWLYFNVMLQETERQSCVQWESWSLRHQQAKFSISGLTDGSFEEAQKNSVKALDQLFDLLFPWRRREDAEGEVEDAENLTREWEAVFGSLEDPEVQDMINRTAEAMYALPQVSDEQQHLEAARLKFEERKRQTQEAVRLRREARSRNQFPRQGGF